MNEEKNPRAPSTVLSTSVLAGVAAVWIGVRLVVFADQPFPLAYVIPMMLCVWTRRYWQLWGSAGLFLVAVLAKGFWILPAATQQPPNAVYIISAAINISLGAVLLHLVLRLRDRVDAQRHRLERQRDVLQQQAQELLQQNDEIKAQSEELVQQQAELESQAEELERSNQELRDANERLEAREEILQAAVDCARWARGAEAAVEELCRRSLSVLDETAAALGLLDVREGELRLRARARREGVPELPARWPGAGSVPAVVLAQDRTIYIDDLAQRPDLAAPLGQTLAYRSILATPVRMDGRTVAVLVACSPQPSHWTADQFRLLEWAAAQAGPLLESLRWQEELRQHTEAVEGASRAKDQFLAMLSHELRTPLTPVLAAAGALEHDPRLPEDVRAELAMIQRNVAVQGRLIDDLLDLTRIARGKLEVNFQTVPLLPLIREAAAIVAADMDANEQSLVLDLQVPTGAAVLGDGGRLQQVFWNLLKNSVKFSPRGGRIGVSARVRPGAVAGPDGEGERVEIEFSDDGVGIEAVDLERIFRPFEQAAFTSRRADATGGLGLGLSIARAIVELHQGALRVRSDGAGQGAVFTVELPMCRCPQVLSADVAAPLSGSSNGSKPMRILLVEDHHDTGMVIARLLRRRGHEVVHSVTMAAAEAAWDMGHFDLLLSDIGLPDGSGFDLMRRIREKDPRALGICMSGYGMEADVQASRDAGFAEHLTKPVDLQLLFGAVRRLTVADPA